MTDTPIPPAPFTVPLTVLYTCTMCGLLDAPVQVPARLDPDAVDVAVWMEATLQLVGADHHRRSPTCHPKKLTNLKIPIMGEWVGAPVTQ